MGDSKSTNPYPLHLLVALSRIALVEMIGPNLRNKKVEENVNDVSSLLLTQVDEVLVRCMRRQTPDVKICSRQRLSVFPGSGSGR